MIVEVKGGERIHDDGSVDLFVGAYVDPELKEKLQAWAKEQRTSLSSLVVRLLLEAVQKPAPANLREKVLRCPHCRAALDVALRSRR